MRRSTCRSVHHLRAVLRAALNHALEDGLVVRNVATGKSVKVTVPHKAMKFWDGSQAKHFLASVKGDALEPVYVLALTTGMRQGEILGLTWNNVDFATGELRVEQSVQRVGKEYRLSQPKTDKSRRVLSLPRPAIDALIAHRDGQPASVVSLAHIRNEKVFPGLVFRATNGGPLNGSYVHHRFQAASKAAGLPVIRFHDTRHSAAACLLAMGVPIFDVSRTLGHSSIKTTGDIYGHLADSSRRGVAAAMEAALG